MTARLIPVWLVLALVSGSACGAVSARAEAHDEWRRSYPVATGASFEIRNTNGRIKVEAGGTKEQMDRVLEAFTKVGRKLGLV